MSQVNYVQSGPFWARYPQDEVKCEEVIICTKKKAGDGKDDPYRYITEVLTKKGEIIAQHDPGAFDMGVISTATFPGLDSDK